MIQSLYFSLPLMLLASWANADLALSISDASENLYGDSKRKYLDITSVDMEIRGEFLEVNLSTLSRFPPPSYCVGTGLQLSVAFYSGDFRSSEALVLAKLELSNRGWTALIERDDSSSDEPESFDFTIRSRRITLVLPAAFYQNSTRITIDLNSSNYPKWTPITGNPTIEIDLAPKERSPQ